MAFTQSEKASRVLEFAKTESWTLDQRAFRAKLRKEAPERKSIMRWQDKLMKDGCLCPGKKTGRPPTSQDTVDRDAMLKCVWQELDYSLGMCCITNGAHIEDLWTFHENSKLQAFRMYQMRCYILNSLWDIQYQNVLKTFGTPWIVYHH